MTKEEYKIIKQVAEIAYWAGKTQSAQDAAQQIDQLYRKEYRERLAQPVIDLNNAKEHINCRDYNDALSSIYSALFVIKQELQSDE